MFFCAPAVLLARKYVTPLEFWHSRLITLLPVLHTSTSSAQAASGVAEPDRSTSGVLNTLSPSVSRCRLPDVSGRRLSLRTTIISSPPSLRLRSDQAGGRTTFIILNDAKEKRRMRTFSVANKKGRSILRQAQDRRCALTVIIMRRSYFDNTIVRVNMLRPLLMV